MHLKSRNTNKVMQLIAMCCKCVASVLQCVASVLQCIASVLLWVAVCCKCVVVFRNVVQFVASVLQCVVAACCSLCNALQSTRLSQRHCHSQSGLLCRNPRLLCGYTRFIYTVHLWKHAALLRKYTAPLQNIHTTGLHIEMSCRNMSLCNM